MKSSHALMTIAEWEAANSEDIGIAEKFDAENTINPSTFTPQLLWYILPQRSGVDGASRSRKILDRIANRFSTLHKPTLALRARLNKSLIIKNYTDSILQDFHDILPYLPQKEVPRILDIGCGVGGINILLSRYYNNTAEIYLLDKTKTDKRLWYGFQRTASFYNDLEVARDFLIANGVPYPNIITLTPESFYPDVIGTVDIVMSWIAWGAHFPVSTYAEQVKKTLTEGSILVMHLRKGHGNEDEFRRYFGDFKVLRDDPRSSLILYIH